MRLNPGSRPITGAVICSLGLMLFSWFVHSGFPARLISYGALLFVAFLMSRQLGSWSDLKRITGECSLSLKSILFLILGILMGISMSVFYRWHLELPLFLSSLLPFAIVAALIGSMEELVFRGYLQSQATGLGSVFAILFSSVSHTGYKCFLFLSPAFHPAVDIGFLAFWTFLFGVMAGIIRHFAGNVWPVVFAHALFDILVYGENVNPPWWVW
jgi:membrane protease YdiL (CAAX protease family)